MKSLKYLALGLCVFALTACGGGGSGKDEEKAKPVASVIKLSDSAFTLKAGESRLLTVTANDSGGNPVVLEANAVSWLSSAPVSVSVDANGNVKAEAAERAVPKVVTITATVNDISDSATVTVTPQITAITLEPVGPIALKPGDMQALVAKDQTGAVITEEVQWASSHPAVVTVEKGVVKGVADGSGKISATLGDASSPEVEVTVVTPPPVLTGLNVTLSKTELFVGESSSISVEGVYSDGAKPAITDAALHSSDDAIAAIDPAVGVIAKTPGVVKVTASKGGITSPEVTLTVKEIPVVLTRITLATAATDEFVIGQTRDFAITAIYSNNTETKPAAADVTWSVSDEKLATVKNGVLTAVAAGKVLLTASYQGKDASVEVAVVPPSVTVHFYRPANWKLPILAHWWLTDKAGLLIKDIGSKWPGEDMQGPDAEGWFTAKIVGHAEIGVLFNDGGSADKGFHQTTDQLSRNGGWFVPNLVADKTTGKFGGKWYDNKPTVELPLESIAVSSVDTEELVVELTRQFAVKATFADTSTSDVAAAKVKWEVADAKLAKVSEAGLLTALAPGKVKLTATYLEKTASVEVLIVEQGINVYFLKPAAWKPAVKLHWWSEQTDGRGSALPVIGSKWPGEMMVGPDADGWYKARAPVTSHLNVIFNDGGSVVDGFNQTVDLKNRDKDGWFVPNATKDNTTGKYDGVWYDSKAALPAPKVSASPVGGDFSDSIEITLQQSGINTTAKYALDAADPVTAGVAYKDGDKVKLGGTLKVGEKVKLKLYAQDAFGKTAVADYTFTKVVQPVDPLQPYSTNPSFGKKVANGAIKIDGKNDNEWSDDMIIAVDAANDDPRTLGANKSTHETPMDLTHVWAAWDDENVYLAWQYVNVTDADNVDPANAPQTQSTLDKNISMWVAIDTVAGKGAKLDVWNKNDGKPYWGGVDLPDYQIYLSSNLRADFATEGSKGIISAAKEGTDGFYPADAATGYSPFSVAGIDVAATNALVPTKLWGYADADDAGKADKLVDFLLHKHAKAKDTFYEIKIPLKAIGSPDLAKAGLGVMMGQGDFSAVDTIPNDAATSNTPGVTPSNSPNEWADADLFTAPFARVGK